MITPGPNLKESSPYIKIIDSYKNLSENFTFGIEHLSPFNIIPFWKRHLNINTRLLQPNKNNTINSLIITNFNEIINTDLNDLIQKYTDVSKNTNGVGFDYITST